MQADLERLVELQRVDSAIEAARRSIEQLPARRAALDARVAANTATLDAAKAKETPAMFADTGIPLLFKSCYRMGADKKRMIVKVAGGASILDESNFFRIGQKNIMAMRKLFWNNNVLIDAEDTGKNVNRTVRPAMSTGKVYVKRAGGQPEEL